jgi:hypothetical protein
MKVIKLKFLDGAVFTACATHFSSFYFPVHEHTKTGIQMPEMAKLSVMGKQVFISIDAYNSFNDFMTNGGLYEHDTNMSVEEIDGPPEHMLAGK